MTTSLTGDLTIAVDGQVVILRLDMNALCMFEGETGKPALPWIAMYERGAVPLATEVRAMCRAMMLRHQPRATLAEAGDLLDRHPEIVARVISAALPVADDGGGTGGAGKKSPAPSVWRRFSGALSRLVSRSTSSGR